MCMLSKFRYLEQLTAPSICHFSNYFFIESIIPPWFEIDILKIWQRNAYELSNRVFQTGIL